MSSSSYNSGFSDAKSPEISTFSQTCNLLSQYLKEKGSFGDFTLRNLETKGSPATTMELFPMNNVGQNLKTRNLFHLPQSEVPTMVNSSAIEIMGNEPKAAQVRISYEEEVVMLDDLTTEEAKKLVSYANKLRSQRQKNNSAYACNQNQPSIRPIVRDLPIARKASLHRFLEKRKDRISSKAPYQISNETSTIEKPAESSSWLSLGSTPSP